jgi:dephospho-CoA kinase
VRGAIDRLLDTEDADVLFVAGCEENQAQFHPRFDHIVLLSAPVETLLERVATRTGNRVREVRRGAVPDPGRPRERRAAARRVADHEIRTTAPLDEVVEDVLRLVDT